MLLELAAELRERLAVYGSLDTVKIQSYMWVIAIALAGEYPLLPETSGDVDFAAELAKRQRRAQEREWIGLAGEEYLVEKERLTVPGTRSYPVRSGSYQRKKWVLATT